MSSLEMELVSCMNDSGEFFTNDGDNEFFSKSMITGMPGEEGVDEKEQMRILNDLFGTPGIPSAEGHEYDAFRRDQVSFGIQGDDCNQDTHLRSSIEGTAHCENTQECTDGKPVLSRRRSNPFYSPSRQIMDLVKKKRKPRPSNLKKSQTSATVMTLNQLCGRYKVEGKTDR